MFLDVVSNFTLKLTCKKYSVVKFYYVSIKNIHNYLRMRNLYAGQEATVITGHGTTDWFQNGKGVH